MDEPGTEDGSGEHERGPGPPRPGDPDPGRPTLNTAVRRRRTDRAFYIRLAGAIRQNQRAIERLKR